MVVMSREWARVPTARFCGYCRPPRTIEKGEPAMLIKLPGVSRPLARCQSCAGEAPPELPERVVVAGVTELAQRGFTKAASHAPGRTRGELRAAAREWMPYRDPGEEG